MLSLLIDPIFPSPSRSVLQFSESEFSFLDLGDVSIAKGMVIQMIHAPTLKFAPNVVF